MVREPHHEREYEAAGHKVPPYELASESPGVRINPGSVLTAWIIANVIDRVVNRMDGLDPWREALLANSGQEHPDVHCLRRCHPPGRRR
jgi:hypothetical protein